MNYTQFSRPPRRGSRTNAQNTDFGRSIDILRATSKVDSFLPCQYPEKQNNLSYTRSTKQIKFCLPEQEEPRAQGGRSRSILMASTVTNTSANYVSSSKSKSRWEARAYDNKPLEKQSVQFVASSYKPFKAEIDIESKYKDIEQLKPKSFHDRLNDFGKKEENHNTFMSSTYYRKEASRSKGKFSSTFTKSRVSDKQHQQAPFFNQPKTPMHETYHHPISPTSPNFAKSQINTFSKDNFMPRERIPSRKSITAEPRLSDFHIGSCKGEGRFGKVYMVIHKKTGFLCAMKKIRKDSVKYMIDQFIQEIKIQMYLNHSKLVKMYGYFADEEHFYMLIQYMEEGSLYSLMKKVKKFEQPAAVEKIHQICEAIKEMHDHSIVHRDLKPENVVMTYGVCKVCDFGWSAICQGRRQTYCGTLDYVCPQIIEGTSYDSSVDIWCLGVLAYEMLCGKAPFYDISRKKTMEKIVSCKIESFPTHFSRKAVKFVEMALQKDPKYRVGVQELLDSEFLKGAKA